MGFYFGNLTKKTSFSGKIKKDEDSLSAIFEKNGTGLTVEMKTNKRFSGSIAKSKFLFSGTISALNLLYRFLRYRENIALHKHSVANSATVVQSNSDVYILEETESKPICAKSFDLIVNDNEKLSILSVLVSYVRASCVYIKNLFMGCTANVITAVGAVARFREEMQLHSTYEAESAGSVSAKSQNNSFTNELEAVAYFAPAETTALETAFTADGEATASFAVGADVGGDGVQKTAHNAVACVWAFPKFENGVLSIFQLFSGVQSGDTVEMDMETESAFWANNIVHDGVLSLVFAQTEPQMGNTLEVI